MNRFTSNSISTLDYDLKHSDDIEQFISANENIFINESLSEHIKNILDKRHLTKAEVIRNSQINEVYGYQLLSGGRNPSRDSLICICIGIGLTLDETQELLSYGGFATLYYRSKRDCIIAFCIYNNYSVTMMNELLFQFKQKTL